MFSSIFWLSIPLHKPIIALIMQLGSSLRIDASKIPLPPSPPPFLTLNQYLPHFHTILYTTRAADTTTI